MPKVRRIKLEDWPQADKRAWEDAVREADLLDNPGPIHHWCKETKDLCTEHYGCWLAFLADRGLLDVDTSPAARVTPERVRAYVRTQRNGLAPATLIMRLDGLLRFLLATSPENDWSWLRRAISVCRHDLRRSWKKICRIRPTEELYALGLRLMDGAPLLNAKGPRMVAARFRDGLIIALLAARPIRRKNLAAIRIGRHLVRRGEVWWLQFEARETKQRRPLEFPLPNDLVSYLATYLRGHRPRLLDGRRSDHLWISLRRGPMDASAIHCCVRARTREAFGTPINLHLFRDCAATSLAIEDPVHVRMAAAILGHSSLATTERHYNQARSLEAGRLHAANIRALRQELDDSMPSRSSED